MPGDVNNPRLWEGADLYVAPVSDTELATDLSTPLADPWEAVGLLSEDGASESRDEDSNDFFAWGGKLIRTQRSKHKRSIQVTCLEDNLTVFGLVNPNSTVTTDGGVNKRTVVVPKSDKRAFVLELRDGNITRRRHIPTGEVSEVSDITLSDSDLQAFEITITIYPDAEGVLYYDYDNDPQGVSADGGEDLVGDGVGEEA